MNQHFIYFDIFPYSYNIQNGKDVIKADIRRSLLCEQRVSFKMNRIYKEVVAKIWEHTVKTV